MKRKNNKGFTLVEVLAAVTILGILSVVAITSVIKIIEKSKQQHYTTAEDELKLAAQSYVQQNRSDLPKTIGQTKKIYLNTLVDNKYIEQIKDYSDEPCLSDKSYVQVFKYSQDDYSYIAYLECPNYTSEAILEKHKPTVTITMSETNKTKAASATIKASDIEKLISWSYIVYKDGKEVLNSGSLAVSDYSSEVQKTIDLSSYTPGRIKIVATATNIYGMITTTTSEANDYLDGDKPTCVIKDVDNPNITGNTKEWTSEPVTITVGCIDGDGSGCTREEYTKTFKTTTDIGTITIEDNAGNKRNCKVLVNIDTTPPTVPTVNLKLWSNNSTEPTSTSGLSDYTAGDWSNKNIYTKPSGSTDDHSGLAYYEYKTTGKAGDTTAQASSKSIIEEGTSTIKYRACDKVGNCSNYTTASTIKVDKTAPKVPTVGLYKWNNNTDSSPKTSSGLTTTYTPGTWSNKKIFTEASGSDESGDTSGLKDYRFTTTGAATDESDTSRNYRNIIAEGTSYIKYKACDYAGNCSAYSTNYEIKIDRSGPSAPTLKLYNWANNSTAPTSTSGLTAYTANTWTNKNVYTVASGSTDTYTDVSYYQYTTTGKVGSNTTKGSSFSITTEGTSTIKYRACDSVGNCSSYTSASTIKLDKTNPSVPTVGLYKWTNNSTKPTSSSGLNAYTSNTWTNKKIYTTASGSTDGDDSSGVSGYQYTITGDATNYTNKDGSYINIVSEGISKIKYRACDSAGNCSSYSTEYTIKEDRTDPIIDKITNPSNGNATAPGLTLTLEGHDPEDASGIAKWRYSWDNSEWNDYSNSNKSPFTTTQFTSKRNQDVYISICDNAGNCSSSSTTKIHIVDPCGTGYTTVSDYGEWSACSKKCDTGKRTRTNTLVSTINGSSCGTTTEEESCGTTACCSSTTTTWNDDWTTCSATCGGGTQSQTGTKYSTIDTSVSCGTDSQSRSCNEQACVTFSCSLSSSDVFGASKGSVSGNYSSSWVSASESWGSWCHASGTTCYASGGYPRICIHEACKGMTAKEVNSKWGCDYASLWCSCS